jgi:hypothetical protein
MKHIDPFSDDYDPSNTPEEKTITMCEDCKEIIYGNLIYKIMEILEGRQAICIIIHGSKLYGLDHEDSDTDIKGVFIPSKRDILLGEIPNVIKYTSGSDDSRNSKNDVEIELYSIHHFFKLAMSGDTSAISMLNAPFEKICSQRDLWRKIVENSNIFYSKNMAGLIGFVLTQTSMYYQKGNRLMDANTALNFLEACDPEEKIKTVWNSLPTGEYLEKIDKDGNTFWSICNRMVQDTSSIDYTINIIKSIINSYGKRAKQAYDNDGLDWKAISHAFRVASELSDLYEFGKIRYPLNDFERIKRMKMGELDFKTEVFPDLNSLMDRVHKMSELSHFPEKIDSGKVKDFLYELLKETIK